MKRVGNLYNQIISVENLKRADVLAQKGKLRQFGVIKHNLRREKNILELHDILKEKLYRTSPYTIFSIFEPKKREISRLPYYPNRIVHHAIMLHLEQPLVNSFISQTYSCIKYRGIHKCLRDVKDALKDMEGTDFCLKLDIRKFYPSIDKGVLKKKLRSKIKDRDLLWLLDEIIDSNPNGLPLGNYLSQWLANFYLNEFDHFLKEQIGLAYYFRYCDDLVILHHSKEFLHDLKAKIEEHLLGIGLQLSNYQVFPVKSRGIDFVGYKIYHTHVLLRKSIKIRFKRAIHKSRSVASYWGWCKHANCKNLWRMTVGHAI